MQDIAESMRDKHRNRSVDCNIALRPGQRRQLVEGSNLAELETLKASVRAKVEHPFRYIKRVFDYDKVRYRGPAKNTERLHMLAAFTNLMIGKKYLLA